MEMNETTSLRLKVRQILPTLDLDSATQKTLQERLEEDMGMTLHHFKDIIRVRVAVSLCVWQDNWSAPVTSQLPWNT